MSLMGFSQSNSLPKAIVEDKDTLICFDVAQSKYILKEMYRAVYLDSLNRINERIIEEKSLQNTLLKQTIQQKDVQIAEKSKQIEIKDVQLAESNNKVETLKTEVRIQKTHKWIAIIGGGALTGFMTYLWITK
jgi:hypothetical protein